MNNEKPHFVLPSLDGFTFKVPAGARMGVTKSGELRLSSRIFIPFMLVLFGPILIGGLAGLYYSLILHPDTTPLSFAIFMLPVTLIGAVMCGFHLLGKTEIRVRLGTISYRKSFLGIGLWQRQNVLSLSRIYMRTMRRRNMAPTVPGMVISAGTSDTVLCIQGEYEWLMGQTMRPDHGHFMKEVLKAWLEQIPGVALFDAPLPAAVAHRKAVQQARTMTMRPAQKRVK